MPAAPNTLSSHFSLARDPKMKPVLFSFCITTTINVLGRQGPKSQGSTVGANSTFSHDLKTVAEKAICLSRGVPSLWSPVGSLSPPETRGQR